MSDGFWDPAAAASSPPTEEMFLAAAEAIRNQPWEPHPCQLGQHVVPARALMRPGTYRCVNCFSVVEIPFPLVERWSPPSSEEDHA